MPKIIAVCPKEYPGVNAVLRHGAALGLWKHVDLENELPENDLVILGAWHPCYEAYLDKYRCVVYLTSTFGQMEFSDHQIEITYISRLIELLATNRIKIILAGWGDVADYFNDRVPGKSFYCPYPFSEASLPESCEKEDNSIGVFLPQAPRKNTLNQILAAVKSGMKVYTNLPYEFHNTNVNKMGWLKNTEYFALISRLRITLHCTFTESFSYGAAESLILGTLPIVSLQVAENLNLGEDLICRQCDSVYEISGRIRFIKDMLPEQYSKILAIEKDRFRRSNLKSLAMTKDVLDNLLRLVVK